MTWFRRSRRAQAVEAARLALDEDRLDDAVEGFRRAIELGADDSVTWFNLGLSEKLRRNWAASANCNRRAAELDAVNAEAHWNLGVAATALRDWETARWAWQRLGFDVGNAGPPAVDWGTTPVRLNATQDGGGEVVWGRRIDPCRARIESVPLPDSGHRFGDVVLHDVVPRGDRRVGDRPFPVFDELIRMDPSDLATHEVTVTAPADDDVESLITAVHDAGLGAEDWSSISFICASCSLAAAHRHEPEAEEATWEPVRLLGLAGPSAEIERLRAAWVQGRPGREGGRPEEVG